MFKHWGNIILSNFNTNNNDNNNIIYGILLGQQQNKKNNKINYFKKMAKTS